jgi:hypothetical protein
VDIKVYLLNTANMEKEESKKHEEKEKFISKEAKKKALKKFAK